MTLSPRRRLAVGLITTAAGIAIYLIGMLVGVSIASPVVTTTRPEEIRVAMEAMESAQWVTMLAGCTGALVALIGLGLSLAGAVRWLWPEPDNRSPNGPTP